ncbi:MAG: DUF4079 domain-containing protein [Desulfocapsa sp.]|nr:MAG: DUF4079 domain-containing protein [Desulfocapsa sp.]
MLILHPLIQLLATLVAFYVLLLGVGRFRRLHLQQKTAFNWQRHVRLGTVVLLVWLSGLFLGLLMVKLYWHGLLITGDHGKRAFIILPLILVGLVSGWYMHKRKKKRIVLPLIHGSVNVILLIIVTMHAFSGWQVYDAFILGN